jgi:hypothetical protein
MNAAWMKINRRTSVGSLNLKNMLSASAVNDLLRGDAIVIKIDESD